MKYFRKTAFLLTAAAACMMCALPARAEEPSPTVSLTIQNPSVTEHTFELYQIFSGTVNNDVLENIEWGTSITAEYKNAHPNAAAAAVALETEEDASAFAQALIDENALLAPDDSMTITVAPKEEATVEAMPGYYLIKDQDGSQNMEDSSYTKHILHLTSSVVVTAKISIPTIVMKTVDTNDTEETISMNAASIADDRWVSSADHDVNDTFAYRIECTLPSNYADYDKYSYEVKVESEPGITLKNDVKIVTKGKMASKDDLTPYFTVDVKKGEVVIHCDDLKTIATLSTDSQIFISGAAVVNDKAEIGAVGNTLSATVTYTNDPNLGEDTAVTSPSRVKVFTHALVVHKYGDHKGEAYRLPGAAFTLYKELEGGKVTKVASSKASTEEADTIFRGIDDGKYILVEDTAPAGYNKMDSSVEYNGKTYENATEITLEAVHDTEGVNPALRSSSINGTGTSMPGVFEMDVIDHSGKMMPMTGGRGTKMITAAGIAVIILGLLGLKKRKD